MIHTVDLTCPQRSNSMNVCDKPQTPLENAWQQTLPTITATCGVPTAFSLLLFPLPYQPWESSLTREANISITHIITKQH